MKKYVFFLLSIFLLLGCEKETSLVDESYPIFYWIYFELIDQEGEIYDNDQIEISRTMILKNDQLELFYGTENDQNWFRMGVIDSLETMVVALFDSTADNSENPIYGPKRFESGERWNVVKTGRDELVKDWYYLFRNADDHSKIDTLRIHDAFQNTETYSRTFDFFLNEKPLELHGDGKFTKDNPNYITLQLK